MNDDENWIPPQKPVLGIPPASNWDEDHRKLREFYSGLVRISGEDRSQLSPDELRTQKLIDEHLKTVVVKPPSTGRALFYCPLCGKPLQEHQLYFYCDEHKKFDVAINKGQLVVTMLRGN